MVATSLPVSLVVLIQTERQKTLIQGYGIRSVYSYSQLSEEEKESKSNINKALRQQIKHRLTMAGHKGIEDSDSDSSPEKIYRITDED